MKTDANLKSILAHCEKKGYKVKEVITVRGVHRVNIVTKRGRPKTIRQMRKLDEAP